ncbi:MAG: T9SS type A sorting domain-containing protein, partial [Chitinophagaceae bacterium]|nr:T9SS type A sorting domain-containing protein [Chitinophagaceae bacterium]
YEALSLHLNPSVLQCDEKMYEISAEVSGTFPIQYFIVQAGDTLKGQWNESQVRQTMNPGAFQIIRMLDAAQCELLPALGDSLPFVWPLQPGISFRSPFLSAQNNSQGWYYWKHNEVLIDSSLVANYRPVLSGSYRVGHLNQQTCLQWSEPIALELDEIMLYPNPVEDQLNIDLTSGQRGPVNMKICDMTGRILSEHLLNPGHHQISVTALQTGIYIVKFYTARNDIFIKHQQIFKR